MSSRRKRWQSRLACVWSAEKLFPTLEQSKLFPSADQLPHEFTDKAYLWTWTFPDKESRESATLAMKKWVPHARWLRDTGKKLLRALERGGKRGSYHFHGITHQRWDVDEIRAHASKCGFGRINVKVIPREKVGYVAKYLGKPGRFPIPRGVRLWACIGYVGVRMGDIRCQINELTVSVHDLYPCMISVKRWCLDDVILREITLRSDWDGNPAEIQTMTITKENVQQIATLIAQGAILCVGEYRLCTARSITFDEKDKKTQQPTGRKLTRKMTVHGVEVGNPVEQVEVTEWLPDDANLETVKAPCGKGEPVLIEIASFSRQFGITAKSLHSLANFNGKLGTPLAQAK